MKLRSFFLLFILWVTAFPAFGQGRGIQVIGWLENARIEPSGLSLVAKVDTGAKHSSIKAEVLARYEKEGKPWVRFEIITKKGDRAIIESLVVRETIIKSHKGKYLKRPVVLLNISLGGVSKTVEVNLARRKGFNYALLIGRSFLAKDFWVDVSAKFTVRPSCTRVKMK